MNEKQPNAKQVVRDLMKAAVPERSSELDELWDKYSPEVEVAKDAKGITMNANKHRIQFDNKTMKVLWLMGFNGWQTLGLYSPAVFLSGVLGVSIDGILMEDEERGPLEFDHKFRSGMAEDMLDGMNVAEAQWPSDIPRPVSDREELSSIQDKATYDLVCMAVTFVFLHEFRHVMFIKDKSMPPERLEEEIGCDVWARSFMTEKIGEYAQASGKKHQEIQQKRAMAIALGAVIIHSITPATERWGTADYPPIADRLHSMVSGIGPSNESNYWIFAACLLISILRREGRELPMIAADPRELVSDLIEQLR